MECLDARPFVSVLYDGERVPEEAAEHISGCASCRRQLRDYAAIGAELRLSESRPVGTLPRPAWLAATAPRRGFPAARALTAHVRVPWFAVALAAGVIVALSIGINLTRAQTPALWFQYRIYPADVPTSASGQPRVVKSGDREPRTSLWPIAGTGASPSFSGVGLIYSVVDIQTGRVRLNIRARHYPEPPKPEAVKQDIGNLSGHEYVYVPGQTLTIPIEGGGTLLLSGQVFDQQPKLAWGYFPLEPAPNQMVLTNFALFRDDQVLSPPSGWGAMIDQNDRGISLYLPGEGLFTFALQPFEGAVKGDASWSEAKFEMDGHKYCLLAGSLITGGDQPHDIWVSLKTDYLPPKNMDRGALFINRALQGAHN